MESSRLLGAVPYSQVRPIPIADAVRHGWGVCLATISAGGKTQLPKPFFSHDIPFQFAWWGANFFTGNTHGTPEQGAPLTINSFKHASLVGRDGVLFLQNGFALDYHTGFVQWFRAGSLIRQIDGHLWRPDLVATEHPGRCLMGHTAAWSNHAHWLVDTMPIWVYYATHLRSQSVKLVVPPLSPVQSETLTLLGIEDKDLVHATDGIMRFEDLLVPSQISLWDPPALMRNAALRMVSTVTAARPPMSRKRLYLSRKDAAKRHLVNDASVEAMLVGHGFDILLCAELSFAEQVAHAASAEIVVGCHGAAMANTIFCPSDCAVIELFPEYCAQPQIRAAAAQSGCRYGYVMGTSFDHETSRDVQNSWDANFVIQKSVLERAVRLAAERPAQTDI